MSAIPDGHDHILQAMPVPEQAGYLYFRRGSRGEQAVAAGGIVTNARRSTFPVAWWDDSGFLE